MSSIARLSVLSFVVALSCSATTASAETVWKFGNKKDFCTTFPAGQEADGKPLFIGVGGVGDWMFTDDVQIDEMGHYDSEAAIPRDGLEWHLGKVGEHLKLGMTYAKGVNERNTGKFFVFCPENADDYHWVAAKDGDYPDNAVRGWNAGEEQMVCRMSYEGGVHPGKLLPAEHICVIGWGGHQETTREYEVLARSSIDG